MWTEGTYVTLNKKTESNPVLSQVHFSSRRGMCWKELPLFPRQHHGDDTKQILSLRPHHPPSLCSRLVLGMPVFGNNGQ